MYIKIDDSNLKAHYYGLLNERNKYTGHCDSISYLNREMSVIRSTLNMLGLEADWCSEED